MKDSLSCKEALELISEFYDGELPKETKNMIQLHLSSCENCREEYERLTNLSKLIKESSDNLSVENCNISDNVIQRLNAQDVSCSEVLGHLSSYYDGEVDLKLHYSIQDHIQNCSNCRIELIKLKNLSQLIKTSACQKSLDLEETAIFRNVKTELYKIKMCNYVTDNLSAYIDRELSKDEIIKISEHLLECKYCRRDYENLKQTSNALKQYFDNYKNKIAPRIYNEPNVIVREVSWHSQKDIISVSIAAIAFLTLLSWFSIHLVEPQIIKNTFKQKELPAIEDAKENTIYVKAEDYFLQKAYLEPEEGVISILYEN